MQDISLEKAQELLLREVREIPLLEAESVPLLAALGRRLAEDCCAAFDQPPFDRSPLDGYALLAACTQGASADAPARFRVIGEECAGSFFAGKVGAGEALRLMTGAAMPEGADTVVRQEDVRVEGEEILVPYALKHHENFCFRGEDVEEGAVLAKAGDRLTAAHIAVLAGQGRKRLPCVRRVRIVLASTGDELVEPGEPLCPGKIYNSNLYLLAARLKEMGFEAEILGALPDDAEEVARALVSSAEPPDLVLTTGGVSVGKKDIMHDVIKELNAERLFWRVLMKPGAPAIGYTFSAVGDSRRTPGIALSGNPFAASATFELLVRPVLAKLTAQDVLLPRRRRAVLRDGFSKESRGRRFVRAQYAQGEVHLPEKHASGVLFSAVGCNALVDIPAGSPPLAAGAEVDVILL